MIRILAVVVVMVWLIGMTTSIIFGGWIQFILMAAVAWITLKVIRGRRTSEWLFLSPRPSHSFRTYAMATKLRERGSD